jgi:hypothetical protein
MLFFRAILPSPRPFPRHGHACAADAFVLFVWGWLEWGF